MDPWLFQVVAKSSSGYTGMIYVLVQSRRMSLRGETGPFTEPHPPWLDWFICGVYPCTPPPWVDWFIRGAYIQNANYTQPTIRITLYTIDHHDPYDQLCHSTSSSCNYNYTVLHILTRNHLFFLVALFLHIVLFLLLLVLLIHFHVLVLLETLSLNIQFFQITFVVFSALLLLSSAEEEYVCTLASPGVFARSHFWLWLGLGVASSQIYLAGLKILTCAGLKVVVALGWMQFVALIKFTWIQPAECAYMRAEYSPSV